MQHKSQVGTRHKPGCLNHCLFERATAEKIRCQEEVNRTNKTIELANRLVKGLEVLIPMTEGLDPVSMLTDDTTIAKWNNEGLPSDTMSTQNATILTNCECWPLLIDPQLQGLKWIKSRYGSDLKVIQFSQKGCRIIRVQAWIYH
ncbi:hypothetical protein Y1Q_0011502 [Alligator mississippiensis]|uniref:Dynein heavy chain ATP-binding dynein motor region domain-containing protein n=1 Tax=Alligator mississippiensis TaxID=8496 RepID=A0A151LZY0_ALLMI|nr:hypothetical protein Y1Q_0011502 [Alligator mississippiensis]